MWIMGSFGILMPAIRPVHTVPKGDERTLQIRARRSKDLDILRARYMQGTLGANIATPDKDYDYRAYCKPEDFAWAIFQMVMEIDYKKFKPTTVDLYADNELHNCYNAIWSVVMGHLSSPRHRYDYYNGPSYKVTEKGVEHKHYSTVRPKEELPGWDGFENRFTESSTGWPASEHRGGKADRDDYNPDVLDAIDVTLNEHGYAVFGGSDDATAEYPILNTGNITDTSHYVAEEWTLPDPLKITGEDLVNQAWAEIDAIIAHQDDPIDHTKCDHGQGRNSRDRCMRKHRREDDVRIAELRHAIFEYERETGRETGLVATK